MRLLFKAALRAKNQYLWLSTAIVAMLLLQVAGFLEIISLSIITNAGSDFFSLFSDASHGSMQGITLSEIEEKWQEISKDGIHITPSDASYYIAYKSARPHAQILHYFNELFQFGDNTSLFALLALIVGAAFFKAVMLFSSKYITQLLSIKVSQKLRQDYFEHIQTLPMSFYQKYNIGSLSQRVAADSTQIAISLNSLITNYITTPFTGIITLTGCLWASWKLTLIILSGLPLIIIPMIILTRKVKGVTRQLKKNQESFASLLIDFLSGIQTVKVFSMERFSIQKYKEHNDGMARLESKTAKYDLLVRPVVHLVTTLCMSTMLFIGLYVLNMSLSELVLFVGFLLQFYEPIKRFAEENSSIQKGVVAAERLFEVLLIEPQIKDIPNAEKKPFFQKMISFENVVFGYDNTPVINGISFNIFKGEHVAIVGKTGCGKSTILQLLLRLYDVQDGCIKIDGVDIRDISLQSIRNLTSFVPQKPFLFIDTVKANIAFGKKLSKSDITVAAKKADAHNFISKLENGYDTDIAEMGKNISGGQQQRIAIARAFAKHSPILLFDEATSALDTVSESKIKNAIDNLGKNVTTIVVAHRLSTIANADKIIVMDEGRIVGIGPKDDLLATCTEFKEMWQKQLV